MQFPPPTLCSRCRVQGQGHDTWNEEEVLNFLLRFYGEGHLVTERLPASNSSGNLPTRLQDRGK